MTWAPGYALGPRGRISHCPSPKWLSPSKWNSLKMALWAQDPQLPANELQSQVTGLLRTLNKEPVVICPHCAGWAAGESGWAAP